MTKFDLAFSPPVMNAAGSLGFSPDRHGLLHLERLGAFITNPISRGPRSPAHGERCLAYPGGFLLHSGYPNPGFKQAIRRYGPLWAGSPLPVIVHLLVQEPDELPEMVRVLESLAGIAGIEVGLPPEVEARSAARYAISAAGELPLVLRLPLDRAIELAPVLLSATRGEPAGPAAFSLGPPRGALSASDGQVVEGRLYGPGLFPSALAAVRRLARLPVPLIGGCGVYTIENARAMINAGAVGVQLDAVIWREREILPGWSQPPG